MSWCIYSWVFCGMNMNRTRIALGDTFGIYVDDSRIRRFRHSMTAEYEGLYSAILQNLLQEKVIHIDETSVKVRHAKGYVWVMAGMDKVHYFYKPTREGVFSKRCCNPLRVF